MLHGENTYLKLFEVLSSKEKPAGQLLGSLCCEKLTGKSEKIGEAQGHYMIKN